MAIHVLQISPEVIAHYSRTLACEEKVAFPSLAKAIAAGPGWHCLPDGISLLCGRPPWMAIIGELSDDDEVVLAALCRDLESACLRLNYISYEQAEQDCEVLAEKLIGRFGRDQIRRFRFTAIPRGGYNVLGLLAYALDLRPEQFQSTTPDDGGTPLVVVDDCALTGARFHAFLKPSYWTRIIFAPLYSHPDLRAAIEDQESCVSACLSARNLKDYGPERMGADNYAEWRKRWGGRIAGFRYWFGQMDHVCFPWNEPDRMVWNPVTEKLERGWSIVPSSHCAKNRWAGNAGIPVQEQSPAKGPLRPSERVVFGEFRGEVVIADVESENTFSLADTGASMWNAIVMYGSLDSAVEALSAEYQIREDVLRSDLKAFVSDLICRGLLTDDQSSCIGRPAA